MGGVLPAKIRPGSRTGWVCPQGRCFSNPFGYFIQIQACKMTEKSPTFAIAFDRAGPILAEIRPE